MVYNKGQNKGQSIKDNKTNMDSQKDSNIKDISPNNDPSRWVRYVSLKSQKLAQATYLVTSLLPDSEPLKWRLRDIALDMLSDLSVLHPNGSSSSDNRSLVDNGQLSPLFKVNVIESAILKIEQIISWFDVALAGNFASDMNLVLMRNEFSDFNNLLREKVKTINLGKLVQLDEGKLLPTETKSTASPALLVTDRKLPESKGQGSQTNVSYQKLSRLPHKSRDLAKDSRRSLILDFLKGKDWTSIKDITEAISGCSAKTIQRELADLVHQGILKKKGDRRWSRYLLS